MYLRPVLQFLITYTPDLAVMWFDEQAFYRDQVASELHFTCTSISGGILLLKNPATRTVAQSKFVIVRYIKAHFESWLEFANQTRGIGLQDEDLLFVSGTTMASEWATIARGDSQAGKLRWEHAAWSLRDPTIRRKKTS